MYSLLAYIYTYGKMFQKFSHLFFSVHMSLVAFLIASYICAYVYIVYIFHLALFKSIKVTLKPADTVHNCSQQTHMQAQTVCCDCATGLVDEQQKVRTISALAIAALAEAATPYGIESFDSVLKPLWKGIRQHRGKVRRPFNQM